MNAMRVVLALLAVSVLAVGCGGDDDDDELEPGPTATTGETAETATAPPDDGSDSDSAALTAHLVEEATLIVEAMRAAGGEPCDSPCEDDPAELWPDVEERCLELAPAEQIDAPGYDAGEHAALVEGLDLSCGVVSDMMSLDEVPDDSPEWQGRALLIVDTLEPFIAQ